MGLEGISINQLRIAPDKETSGFNPNVKLNSNDIKIVDGLATGQKVDPDKEREHEKRQLNKKYNSPDDSSESETEEEFDDSQSEAVVKYDLSVSGRYNLVLDDASNEILIVEKKSGDIIQKIDPDALSNFVNYLPYAQGAMINRKF